MTTDRMSTWPELNFAGKDPREVYEELLAMRKKSDQAKKEGDDHKAYVTLKRWLDSVDWLRRTRVKDGKSVCSYATIITVDQINEVKNILADMKQKLEVRHELNTKNQNNTVEKMGVETNELDTLNRDIRFKYPTEEPLYEYLCSDNDLFISCNQLHYLIQKIGARYLIIDTRPKAQYESSNILAERYINIPKCEIKEGLMSFDFLKCFTRNTYARDLFINRSEQDILVLLDWNTTPETLAQCIHIKILKEIFRNDYCVRHHKIRILNGGYQEWLKQYPAFTWTSSNIQMPNINNIENEILETFEYPNSSAVYSNVEEERIRKNKLNNNNIDVDHVNKSAISVVRQHKQKQQPQQQQQEQQQQQQQQQKQQPQQQQQEQQQQQQQKQQPQQQQQEQQQQQQQQQQPVPQQQQVRRKRGRAAGKSRASWWFRHRSRGRGWDGGRAGRSGW